MQVIVNGRNLAASSYQEASGPNRRHSPVPQSGVRGVSWHTKAGQWRTTITHQGKEIHIGYYTELSHAITARKAVERVVPDYRTYPALLKKVTSA